MSVTLAAPTKEKRKRESKPADKKVTGKKVTVVLPDELIARLNELVPARHRSKFISGAISEKVDLAEQATAFEEAAGLWKDEEYPHLKTKKDIDNWLHDLRRGWNRQDSNNDHQHSA